MDRAGPAGLVLQVCDEARVIDFPKYLVGHRQSRYLGWHEELDCTGVPSVGPQLGHWTGGSQHRTRPGTLCRK